MVEKSNVPEIRFAGFADPWEQRKLGELVDVRSGRDYQHLEEGPIPVYGTGGYMTGVNEALSYDEDAIGIGRKGTIDKPYRLFAPFWTVDTLFYAVPRENVNLDFALCLFRNVDWKSKDESTGLPSLSKTIINESDVYVPRNPEQRQIGQLFSRLGALITLHQRKYDKLGELKKSLLEKMFPKEGEVFPEIRFAGFADPWEQRKLGNELLFLRNNTLSRADLNGVQGDALDVHYGDVLVKYGAVLNVAKTTLPRITKSGQPGKTLGDPLNDGDIIMSDTAEDETAGKCSELCEIRDRTVYSGLHTIPCRPRRKYASGFLGHYLNAPVFHNQLIPLMQGIKVISLSKTSLSEANLVVPSIREQEKISATFSRLDTLITLHQRKLELLRNIKKALLDKMFVEGE